jgi:cellulose biosynthesis protein BcsQ
MKNIIAVCDRDIEYAHRLMEYMNHKNSVFMKAAAFSEESSIVEYGSRNKISLLLISEDMLNEKTSSINAKKKVVLMESRGSSEFSETQNIYKYQSAENIVREVMSSYEAENMILKSEAVWRGKKRIICVYSPVGGARKTTFALALGQILARQVPVLYINLESFSGLREILGLSCQGDLGDLLYYAAQKETDPVAKLPFLTETVQELDVIPPVQSPDDLREISSSKLMELFSEILSRTAYETLIIEPGNEIQDIADIFEYCSEVYIPVREDPLARAKLENFEEYIEEKVSDIKKIHKIKLPFNMVSALGKEFSENLIWSELGDFVRGLIQKGSDIEQYRNFA